MRNILLVTAVTVPRLLFNNCRMKQPWKLPFSVLLQTFCTVPTKAIHVAALVDKQPLFYCCERDAGGALHERLRSLPAGKHQHSDLPRAIQSESTADARQLSAAACAALKRVGSLRSVAGRKTAGHILAAGQDASFF